MYNIDFYQISEIRMGSPYNTAKIKVHDGYFPKAFLHGIYAFQDKAVVSKDGNVLFLVMWSYIQGDPGFKILKILNKERKVYSSKLMSGCCKSIELNSNDREIKVSIFRYPSNVFEVIDDFPSLIADDEALIKERYTEEVLPKWTTFTEVGTFTHWLSTLRNLVNNGALIEVKGSVTLDLLQNHLHELLKSDLDEAVYFKSYPEGNIYHLTIKNQVGFFVEWTQI